MSLGLSLQCVATGYSLACEVAVSLSATRVVVRNARRLVSKLLDIGARAQRDLGTRVRGGQRSEPKTGLSGGQSFSF